jgi:hypothetical protein
MTIKANSADLVTKIGGFGDQNRRFWSVRPLPLSESGDMSTTETKDISQKDSSPPSWRG